MFLMSGSTLFSPEMANLKKKISYYTPYQFCKSCGLFKQTYSAYTRLFGKQLTEREEVSVDPSQLNTLADQNHINVPLKDRYTYLFTLLEQRKRLSLTPAHYERSSVSKTKWHTRCNSCRYSPNPDITHSLPTNPNFDPAAQDKINESFTDDIPDEDSLNDAKLLWGDSPASFFDESEE